MAYPTDWKKWYLAGPNSWGVRMVRTSTCDCELTERETPMGKLVVCGKPVPVWGSSPECPLIPVSEWRPVERAWAVWEIVDQAIHH